MVNKRGLTLTLIFLGAYLIVVLIFLIGKQRNNENIKKVFFEGYIEKIEYNDKSIATVWVRGVKYVLTYLPKFKGEVRVGDFIRKKAGSDVYVVIKQDTHEVYNY